MGLPLRLRAGLFGARKSGEPGLDRRERPHEAACYQELLAITAALRDSRQKSPDRLRPCAASDPRRAYRTRIVFPFSRDLVSVVVRCAAFNALRARRLMVLVHSQDGSDGFSPVACGDPNCRAQTESARLGAKE